MLRAVTTPSNGATILAKAFSAFSRWTLASAASTSASLALASLCFSSAACCDTAADARSEFQRCAVTLRQRLIGFRLGQLALGDGDALVEFRRVDDREDVALADLGADVLAPLAERSR